MGRYFWRPDFAAAVDYGNVDTDGSGAVLGDNTDSTRKKYFSDSGSILTFVPPSPSVVPAGRSIIAVRAGHRQTNQLLFNGWPRTYLRVDGKRQENTVVYKQDGNSSSVRQILGPALYNLNLVPWTWADINKMSAETGAAIGEIGPNKKNRWCIATEVFIQIIWNDPVPTPTDPYPAANQTIDTSSVQFSAKSPAPQEEQPVQTVFQVCRVNTFDNDDVRSFVGGLNGSTDANSRSYYVSDPLDTENDSYTDLGPGDWYLRIKNRDYLGNESAWSAVTKFTVAHGALPTPSITDPTAAATVNTPYRPRKARIAVQPVGGRRVGVEWQFARDAAFTTSVVQWANTSGGTFVASAGFPFDIQYDPKPNPATQPGKNGPTVAPDDPSQYLAQGGWYGRVRCADVYGQFGPWSSAVQFTVTHPPVPNSLIPTGGASFDQAEAPVRWTFGDPWNEDYQTAYRMRVYDNAMNLIQDTGKVASGLSRATMNVSKATYHRQVLTVNIDTWDADDVPSNAGTPLTGTLLLSTAPVTTIIYPEVDDAIPSGQPNFQWSNVFAVSGITQKSFRLRVTEISSGTLVYDSGVITSAGTSHQPTRPILKNLFGYQVSLTITDSEDLAKEVRRNFSTNFDRPETVTSTADPSLYDTEGYVNVLWPTGNPDPFFKEWRIYRKRAAEPDNEYVLAGTVANPAIREFKDWLISGSDEFVYSVVQVAYRFGSPVESEHSPTPMFYIYSDYYWLIVPTNPELNLKLTGVGGDRYTSNQEMADYNIIGGGRRRTYGTKYGKSGNLTAKVRHSQGRTASRFIRDLQRVADNRYSLYMRDPFGNVTLIAIGEISLERMPGVGDSEFGDLDIPYIEVGEADAAFVAQ
ncbi:minor tail protein [Gordonia phage Jumbo]|uniref:Minor tail protein n=1 Tax=Gordonia phage Jumbo TaxID=1887650 RepID=A0A1B3B0J2_9CAUD|nr:minor tail protein [Gordonia phage Jumbo]AOE44533.1 minor tail protein [Gordonia phage Jumbo]